jgi:glycosyltransferase involved in cell wall biosynthesis
MKTLTVVAPAYNEAEGIGEFYRVLRAELNKLTRYDSDILFVVDGGVDRTIDILRELAERDTRLRVLKFSRNFGHQMAYLAGLDHAHSDVIVMMDSDLQHPPSVIPQLLSEHEAGADIVYTIREHTKNLGWIRRLESYLFYGFLNLISEIPITENSSDFRLLSKRVVKVIQKDIRERSMFLRGIVNWIGFKQVGVRYSAAERFAGHSKLPLRRLLKFAMSGILSFSTKPLRAASIVGTLIALFGLLFALVTVIRYFTVGVEEPGYATIVVLVSLLSGVQLIFLGIIGEYIGAIFDQVKQRPHYIVEEAIHIDSAPQKG